MAKYNSTTDSTVFRTDSTYFTTDRDPNALQISWTTPVLDDYLGKVTPWQRKEIKARFLAEISVNVQPYVDNQDLLSKLPYYFDIDYAVGAQLDVVGIWVGRSRLVKIPIPNSFFSWGVPGLGWGQGYWKGPYDGGDGLSRLPDDIFRRLLYAKRASNAWNGTELGAEAIVRTFFTDPATLVFVEDDGRALSPPNFFSWGVEGSGWGQGVWYSDAESAYTPDSLSLAYKICIAGRLPPAIELRVLGNDLIEAKTGGVSVDYAVTSVDGAPLFGFGLDNEFVSGFGKGAWATDPATAAGLVGAPNIIPATKILSMDDDTNSIGDNSWSFFL
jgi:hypothetical protein